MYNNSVFIGNFEDRCFFIRQFYDKDFEISLQINYMQPEWTYRNIDDIMYLQKLCKYTNLGDKNDY